MRRLVVAVVRPTLALALACLTLAACSEARLETGDYALVIQADSSGDPHYLALAADGSFCVLRGGAPMDFCAGTASDAERQAITDAANELAIWEAQSAGYECRDCPRHAYTLTVTAGALAGTVHEFRWIGEGGSRLRDAVYAPCARASADGSCVAVSACPVGTSF